MFHGQISIMEKSIVLVVVVFISQGFSQSQPYSEDRKLLSNEIVGSESPLKPIHIVKVPGSQSNSNLAPTISSPSTSSSFVATSNANNYRDYGHQALYYPQGHKPMIWNRDSYVDAATDFGYHPPAQQQQHHAQAGPPQSSYLPAPEQYGLGEGLDEEGAGPGAFGGLGGLGGLGGIAGVLGIKGIKGLGILALLKAGLPLLALLLPALLLLPLILLFLPVPVITVPSTGRAFNTGGNLLKFRDVGSKVAQLARSVLDSEQCVERMSCELSRVSRGTLLDKTLKRVFVKFETHLSKSLQRAARAYMDQTTNCFKKYSCYLVDDNSVKKSS